jgi:hypothetical protein
MACAIADSPGVDKAEGLGEVARAMGLTTADVESAANSSCWLWGCSVPGKDHLDRSFGASNHVSE